MKKIALLILVMFLANISMVFAYTTINKGSFGTSTESPILWSDHGWNFREMELKIVYHDPINKNDTIDYVTVDYYDGNGAFIKSTNRVGESSIIAVSTSSYKTYGIKLKVNPSSSNIAYAYLTYITLDDLNTTAETDEYWYFATYDNSIGSTCELLPAPSGSGGTGGTTTPTDFSGSISVNNNTDGTISISYDRLGLDTTNTVKIYYGADLVYSGQALDFYDGLPTPTQDTVIYIEERNSTGELVAEGSADYLLNGGTTPTDPTTTDGCGCDIVENILTSTLFPEYLAQWDSIIPDPPNWQEVAGIMRDTIVPSMAQEIVNRSPEIADILANELQSREKPVTAPNPLPSFSPSVPTLNDKDLSAPITTDLNTGIPAFTPDFTGSQSFNVPDPASWVPDNTDQGYIYPLSIDNTSPSYNQQDVTMDQDIGYQAQPTGIITTPSYSNTNPTSTTEVIPRYTAPNTNQPETMPDYITTDSGTMPNYTTTTGTTETIPIYQGN